MKKDPINKIIKYLINTKELIILLTFYFSFFQFPFADKSLEIEFIDTPFILPKLFSQPLNISSNKDINEDFKSFSTSDMMRRITIRNNSAENIENLEIILTDIRHIGGVAITTSSSLLDNDNNQLIEYKTIDRNNIYFHNLNMIPRKTLIVLTVYGTFKTQLFANPVVIEASTEKVDVVEYRYTSGVGEFIDYYSKELFIVLVILALLIVLKRFKHSK